MPVRDPEWDRMFDLQYALSQEIDALITEKVKGLPKEWRAVLQLDLIEHLSESARFYLELTPLTKLREWTDAERAAVASCANPVFHETHRYCPSCPWTEEFGTA